MARKASAVLVLVAAVAVGACIYNPRPIPPRQDENEAGCAHKAKADYQVCLASGRSNTACDQMHDGVFMRCLMYGGGADAGRSVPESIGLPGVYTP